MTTWQFTKGHGTGNDFIFLLDRHGMTDPTAAEVRWLCDRHRGIGADGVIRVVPASHLHDWDGDPELWFMDYRNADGSVAQMCGNGSRVFARYLLDNGLVEASTFDIATRAGLKSVQRTSEGMFRIGMGTVTVTDTIEVEYEGQWLTGVAADVGNPHAVVNLESTQLDLAAMTLLRQPAWRPEAAFPEGTNVEFVLPVSEGRVAMRVYERGVGETLSCGTGTVAVAAVQGRHRGEAHQWQVDVPGGSIIVELSARDGNQRQAWMSGPAVLVATGEVTMPDDCE